jgi:glycosyltransferase involved in cell wall biosynthesis
VIVNDGSSDNTAPVIRDLEREAQASSASLQAIHQVNAGVARARNAGAEAATGKYIAWLDDDDTWEPTKTSKQVQRMRECEAQACCGYLLKQSPGGNERHPAGNKRLPNGNDGAAFVRGECYAHINSVIFERRLWAEVGGFDPDLRWSEDVEWLARLAFVAKFCSVEEIVGTYTYNPKGISRLASLDQLIEQDRHHIRGLQKTRERCSRLSGWEEVAWNERAARDFDQFVKHLLYAGRLDEARESWAHGMQLTARHPRLARTRSKLRKARFLALLGMRLKHPKFQDSEVTG